MSITSQINTWGLNLMGNEKAQHVLFWTALLLVFLALDQSIFPLWFVIIKEAINVLFYVGIVYFNLYILFPAIAERKRFMLYGIGLIAASFLMTPIKIFTLFLLFTNHPEMQHSVLTNWNLIFLSILFVAMASTLYKIISDWMKHQREKKDLQTQTMRSELNFLRSQINPHFLFNTLNNLYALTLKKSNKAPEIVLKLSEMMRYMLYECNEKRVPLKKEVSMIRNYLALEQLRQGEGYDIRFQLNGDVRDQQIAPLMFIPFLENAFKHGVSHSLTSGYIHVELTVDDHEIDFSIVNSKPERVSSPSRKISGGIGLPNVRRRLNLIYPNTHQLDVTDSPNNYKVRLQLKLDHE